MFDSCILHRGCSSAGERCLSKAKVQGSNPCCSTFSKSGFVCFTCPDLNFGIDLSGRLDRSAHRTPDAGHSGKRWRRRAPLWCRRPFGFASRPHPSPRSLRWRGWKEWKGWKRRRTLDRRRAGSPPSPSAPGLPSGPRSARGPLMGDRGERWARHERRKRRMGTTPHPKRISGRSRRSGR